VTALALIENLQREDLNPVEEARAYQRLSENEGLTQQEIARFVDKSRSHVANLMRLLSLPEEVLDMVQRDDLSMGHARALVGRARSTAAGDQDIVAKGLSVRDAERLAKRASAAGNGPAVRVPSATRRIRPISPRCRPMWRVPGPESHDQRRCRSAHRQRW
jgi:ParB family chromosome partitioning protein